jgi:hypothetical protein
MAFVGGMFRIDFPQQKVSIYRGEKETMRMVNRAEAREAVEKTEKKRTHKGE